MPVDETETRWWEKTYQQEGATRRRRRSWSGADNLTPARQHCMTHCTALRCTSWLVAQVSALSDCLIHTGPGGRPDLRKTLVGSGRCVLTSPTYWSISILGKLALVDNSGSNPYHTLHLHGKGLSDSSPRLCHHHRMRPCLTTTWCLLRSSSRLCVPATVSLKAESTRHFSSAIALLSEPDYAAARKWQAQLGTIPITDEIGEVSYARSSGPGGQNVNKCVSPTSIERGHC